jgi:glutathione S-transferase
MLELYTSTHCPYCKRVIAYLEEAGIPYEERNVALKAEYRDELISLGGKMQIPFLVDRNHDVHMYESADIIRYLGEHYSAPSPS